MSQQTTAMKPTAQPQAKQPQSAESKTVKQDNGQQPKSRFTWEPEEWTPVTGEEKK